MSAARNTWVYLGAVSWLAAVWLGLFSGCGTGAVGGDTAGGPAGDTAPETVTTVTTLAQAPIGGVTSTTFVVDVSGAETTLGLRPTSLNDLSAEIRGLLGESGVPVYLPLVLPPGYDVASIAGGGSRREGQSHGVATCWQSVRARGRRDTPFCSPTEPTASVSTSTLRAISGDIQWADAGMAGVYGPLRTTTASGTTWVAVENPDGVEIVVSGDTGVSEALLSLASKVARVEGS